MGKIWINAGGVSMLAELNESGTAIKIWRVLPIETNVNTWGDEIFFEIPVVSEEEPDARSEVDVGELGYWPVGNAFCIFFGPTPVSTDERPRAASPVNIVGNLQGDATEFRHVRNGAKVSIGRVNQQR